MRHESRGTVNLAEVLEDGLNQHAHTHYDSDSICERQCRLDAIKVLTEPVIAEIVNDEIANRYHPEFGTEWREPDGSLYKIVMQARREVLNEAADNVRRIRENSRATGPYSTNFETWLRERAEALAPYREIEESADE